MIFFKRIDSRESASSLRRNARNALNGPWPTVASTAGSYTNSNRLSYWLQYFYIIHIISTKITGSYKLSTQVVKTVSAGLVHGANQFLRSSQNSHLFTNKQCVPRPGRPLFRENITRRRKKKILVKKNTQVLLCVAQNTFFKTVMTGWHNGRRRRWSWPGWRLSERVNERWKYDNRWILGKIDRWSRHNNNRARYVIETTRTVAFVKYFPGFTVNISTFFFFLQEINNLSRFGWSNY